ncbi:T9SS-dependent choice-of-anchor J family protein [Flavobacterium soli]|uniref:T9SS-dependent choice-of-anchor J family protein n=1 Tax=Flavobacterium soli TaxID=344881 RepID=UPI000403739D|nr:choice-of-anchor J domain-containing protein [Flavobacterium soli]
MKKITFSLLLLFASVFLGFSQVPIGNGTTMYAGLPFEPVTLYTYSQTIYRASDMNASGTITSLKWHFTGVDNLENSQDVTVYLAHTTKNAFEGGDWVSLNDLTLVYTGGLEIPESGWIEIPFNEGFVYNGTDNLVVAVKENHPGNDSNYDEFYNSVGLPGTSLLTTSHFEDMNPNPANPPSGYAVPHYPNIIFEGITQTCPTPFNVQALTIGTETATITWNAPVNAPTGGSQYFISTNSSQPSDIIEPSGSITTGNSIDLTNLEAGSTHYIWVRSICENGIFSPWSSMYSFVTVCLPATEVFEDFSGLAPALPYCWKKIVKGPEINEFANVEITDYEPYIARLSNGNDAHESDEILLISPEISNLNAATHRLKFSARDTGGGGSPIKLQIVTLSENTPEATYTDFFEIDTESSFDNTDYVVDFTSYEGTDKYIGFKLDATDWGSIVWIDDVKWEPIPPCPDIDLATIEIDPLSITENTATVSWSNDVGESYEVSYGVLTVTDPNTGTIVATDEGTKELTGLAPDTEYKVWVRSICTEGNGHWIGPKTFKSECVGVDTLNENFDASTELPQCWSSIISGPTLGNPTVYIAGIDWVSFSDPNAASLGSGYSDTDGQDDIILVTPKLSNLGAGTHRFKFRSYSGGSSEDDIQVVVLGNNKTSDEMTVVATFTSSTDMSEHIVEFDTYEGILETFIGIRMNASSPSSTIYIDDIVWEPIPACPDTGVVSISDIEITTATVSWTANDGESLWQIAYGPVTATDPETQTLFTTTTLDEDAMIASGNLTELLENTEYKVWVRTMCGEAGNGQWSLPVTFKTDCTAFTELSENFDGTITPALPSCWSKILRGPTLVDYAVVETTPVPAELAVSGTQVGSIYKGTSGAYDDMIMITPQLSNLSAGTHRLTFHANYRNFIGELQIGTLDSNNPDAVFTPWQDVALTTTMAFYEVDFSTYEGTDTYIGLRINTESVHTAILIDNLAWEPIPECAHLLSVDVVDITDIGAEVIWETPGDESTWQIAHALASVTSPDGLTPVPANLNPMASLTDLEDGTLYNVWVRSVCGDAFGAWFGPITFKTDCTAVTAFSQNFDTTTTPTIPNCWNAIKRGNTLDPQAVIETSSVGAQSAPNVMVIYKATSNVNDDLIVIAPKISNAAAGTHKLTFSAMMQNGAGATLQVGTMDTYSNEGTFTSLESVAPTSAYQDFAIDFSSYSGSDQYIAIRMNSTAFHTVAYIDNVVWEPIAEETCGAVVAINENFDTTAVDTLPACWTEIIRGPSSETSIDAIMVKPIDGASLPNAANIFKGLSGPTDEQILVLPQVLNLSAGTHKLSVHLAGPPCQIEVGTLNNNTEAAVFTLKETITVTNSWTQTIVDFTNYTGTDSYIGLRLNPGDSPFVSMYIDNVVWSANLATSTFDNDAFRYYPNPVKDILNLSYDKNISKVAVYNILGQEILIKNNVSNQSQIDMSPLASGTYLVKVTADSTEKTFKVIKQ